ncbi:GMP synthase-Glutamine amidotransferase [Epilithonimonas bovis DSM 19482]|uniref:GMP synthase-Glutamine amidotransferase n=1 Tax=Epilithonimonas bovis DSM 19482 TaxID=1121284 RepID=A0A1U7PXN4_9FLAO|nr:GMP synthase [Epilithonimonas bovis]SIT96581.1 GMP synthase-Glutamine amidotransferase [Epilithonimonas bovis DSM 19482]
MNMTKNDVRIALLDMNNNHPNQGMRNIKELAKAFQEQSDYDVSVDIFDVRYKAEMPKIEDFDIFISSGGPGNPHREGYIWEGKYAKFLDTIWQHNKDNDQKKYAFLICHSFQLAVIHFGIANVCKRKSYSFGVMPIHKSEDGEKEFLFKNLPEPFYAVDSRAYQCIEPNQEKLNELGMKVVALEKIRPNVHLERALMAVRFSDEIFGTQFHPEADPIGFIKNLEDPKNKEAMVETFGMEKYLETIDRMDDDDKIVLTRAQIIPRFLQSAAEQITKNMVLNRC